MFMVKENKIVSPIEPIPALGILVTSISCAIILFTLSYSCKRVSFRMVPSRLTTLFLHLMAPGVVAHELSHLAGQAVVAQHQATPLDRESNPKKSCVFWRIPFLSSAQQPLDYGENVFIQLLLGKHIVYL